MNARLRHTHKLTSLELVLTGNGRQLDEQLQSEVTQQKRRRAQKGDRAIAVCVASVEKVPIAKFALAMGLAETEWTSSQCKCIVQ